MTDKLTQSYAILDKLRLDHGLYIASTGSQYQHVWIRDSFYMAIPFLNKECDTYERTYHAILDILRKYEWKLDIHTQQKPHFKHEYLHPRYSKDNLNEIEQEWGNIQHDSWGSVLFGIGEGIKAGKKMLRDEKDKEIIQKLVWYLDCCQYWIAADNGVWEEWEELHSSSIAACVAGLQAVRNIVEVPRELILKGYNTLANMFPVESADRQVDLAQLSLIYPYKILVEDDARLILNRIESMLLRSNGVIRYQGDSYYSTLEDKGRHLPLKEYYKHEAEWCFGIPWLASCQMELGNYRKAEKYIIKTEKLMLPDGSLPELYFAHSNKYNDNTPLGWSNSMYIQAKEKYNALVAEEGETQYDIVV